MKERLFRAIHRSTGEVALVRDAGRGILLAQFNLITHPHSAGWHAYFKRDFKIIWRFKPWSPVAYERLKSTSQRLNVPALPLNGKAGRSITLPDERLRYFDEVGALINADNTPHMK